MNSALVDPRGGQLADLLDWWGLVHHTPAVLHTKGGRLQMTYEACFADTEQMEPDERAVYLAQVDDVLRLLGEGWALDADWWHAPDLAYPATDWDTLDAPLSDRLVDSIRRVAAESRPSHSATLHLTLSWQPPAPVRQWMRHLLVTQGATRRQEIGLRDIIGLFLEGQERFVELLGGSLDVLRPYDAETLCTYLHQSVSWDEHTVACPDPAYDLDWQLSSDLLVPGQPPRLGDMLLQPLTVKSWAPSLRTRVPEVLGQLPFPFRYHVRWVPMGQSSADTFLTWAERRWAGGYRGLKKILKGAAEVEETQEVYGRDDQDQATTAGQSIIDMRRAVRRGDDVAGLLSPTVLCWAPTQDLLDERVKLARQALFSQGLVLRTEQAGASIQWLATLSGHTKYGIRSRGLSTRHLTALIPHTHAWSGPARDAYLDDAPLMRVSADGRPFNLVTHVGNLGNVLVAGPSQTGKSAFFGLAVRQSRRYRKRKGCIFDRDNALKAVTLLSGGKHYTLGTVGGRRLQPLGSLETEEEQVLRALWVENVLVGEGLAPTPDERREILRMIRRLAGLPRRERTLSLARQLLQVTRLKVGLEPFCTGGEYGFCDGDEDPFTWDNPLICFEMSALLTKPRAMRAVLSYCFSELEIHWFTGDPVYIWADECKWLLDSAEFLGGFEVILKARAKKNVSLWAATQELYDLQRTTAWQAILANMPTRILLPNPQAMRPSVRPFYDDLGVSDRALRRLVQGRPFRDYLYTSPLGTRMFQCALSPVERLLCAASTLEELAVLDDLALQYRPDELPAAWLRHWGYPDEAALLLPTSAKEME